jgi:DNA-binding transcriptional ArsR family regulator
LNTKQLARIHKALSNENRLEIFLNIIKYEHKDFEAGCDCVMQKIMQNLCIGAPTISHHLKELSDAGLITTAKNGKFLIATANKEVIEEIKNEFNFWE